MRTPVHTGQFRRDIRRAKWQGKNISKLREVLTMLIQAEPLPPRFKDHPLRGEWRGWRKLHIEPDWLLLYKFDGNDLILARAGSHADLFR